MFGTTILSFISDIASKVPGSILTIALKFYQERYPELRCYNEVYPKLQCSSKE